MFNDRQRTRLPPRPMIVAGLLALGVCPSLHAAIFTVGAGGCTHTSIQAAIDAAQASAGPDTVRITRSATYTGQQIFINTAQDLNVVGGFATCASTVSDGQKTVVSAAGPNHYSVFNVSNTTTSTIKFRLLRLTGGYAANGYGGGINYVGGGTVELIEMAIDTNRANYGGGIYFQGSSDQAKLIISNDNIINGNSADISGGGIYLQKAELTMTAPGSSLFNNSAVNYGGGLRLYGASGSIGTRATVGSSGYANFAAIDSNEARFGGGVAVQGLEDDGVGDADFILQGGARIAYNFASERGGAIDLQNYYGIDDYGDVSATVSGGTLESNAAPEGAAVYVGHDSNVFGNARGGQFQMSGGSLVDHVSVNSSNQPTGGSTVLVSEAGRGNFNRTVIRGNVGGALLRADGSDTAVPVSISHSLVYGNSVQRSLVEVLSGATIVIAGTTIADNAIPADWVLDVNGTLRLEQAIVWQPGLQTVHGAGSRYVDDVLASELVSLGNGASVIYADPRFIDPAHGDYHLQVASPAVDFAGVTSTTDLDGHQHDRDIDRVANNFGSGDLGAYEVLSIGNLVLDPGFLEDLRLWDVVRPGVSTWTSPGAFGGPGSAQISYTRSDPMQPAAGTLIGLSQCVHIPGPGSYRLTGFAYGQGSSFERDAVSLRWAYRSNPGGEPCTGATNGEGIVTFPGSAGFIAPTTPAVITIPANEWSDFTNVEVALAVVEGSFNILGTTEGHFDGIVLEPIDVLPDALLANGFE